MTLAAADGEYNEKEKEWILGYRAALGAPADLLAELQKYVPNAEDWHDLLNNKDVFVGQSRRALIYDSFHAASAD
ncbi:unnamed protein product [Didymodactylos carnosus]|uniref:Uncharacterized protein n=1 Tax=Didymodactylos carnosus TaxID=1234261 RepID=A0A813RZM5_9BILA|nr:unnamed protein product [Didymodactylos carnosus]CAF3576860.1 unnamed protein product [Didymodactylos carnosus]